MYIYVIMCIYIYIHISSTVCVCAFLYMCGPIYTYYVYTIQKGCLFEMGVNENGDATQNDAKLHFEKGIGKHRETCGT